MGGSQRIVPLLLAMVLLGAACSDDAQGPLFGPGTVSTTSATGSASDSTATPTSTSTSDTGGTTTLVVVPESTTTTTSPAGPPRPLPVMEGLATFDTFEWTMSLITVGPTSDAYSDMSLTLSADREADQRKTTIASTVDGPDYDEPETTSQESWQDATGTCSYDGDEYSFEEITAQQREMIDVVSGLFDLQVIPELGTDLGQDPIAGIEATHYRYTISGLGNDSGALVTENEVEYWLADETGALLKYSLVAETRSGPASDPTSEVYRVEASAELRAANMPVDTGFPAACVALRPEATEAPQAEQAGSRIVVRIGSEAIGVLSGEPVCTIEGAAGSRGVTALVDGRIDGTRYRVNVEAFGIAADGEYQGASFGLIVAGGAQLDAIGEASVEVTSLGGGLLRLEFAAGLDGDIGKVRLRGTVTCSGA